jgi:O-antigen/teichoic acid export membrane protein
LQFAVEKEMSLLKTVAGHRFTKQAGRIMLYLGLSRLVSVAGTAWATRCLGPEKLGISGMIAATMGQMVLFVTCSLDNLFIRRYKNAATEEERERWIEMAMSQRFFFSLILGLAGIAVAWFLHPPGQWWLGILAVLPTFVLSSILPAWVNIAQEDLPANFRAAAISSVFMAVLYFMFFRPGQATGSDLVVGTLGMALQFVILSRATLKRLWPMPIHWRKVREFWPVLREGRWLFVTGLVIYVYVSLEVPMLGYLSSLAELGKYQVATKLVASAQQVLGLAPLLLFPRFVEWRKLGADVLWRKQLRLAAIFLALGLPVCVLAFLLSPFVFRLLYGQEFASAAIPFAVLFTSKVVVVLNGLFSYGLWAQSEDRKVFWVVLPTAVISFFCNFLLLPRYGMSAACCVNLFSEVLVLAGCFILARQHLKDVLAKAVSPGTLPTPI